MEVTFENSSGICSSAILKLYDRRFGTNLRSGEDGKYSPCRSQDEAAYQSFLRQGKMGPFLEELEEEYRTALIPPVAYEFSEDEDRPDGRHVEATARFEAALWYEADQHFKDEAEAYQRLGDLQGESIPRVYAHSNSEDYLSVNGILIEKIQGFNLRDLATFLPVPSDYAEWTAIVQRAVDTAHEVNKRGIILLDSGPRNVMVDLDSKTPFIIDLAQCYFKDRMFDLWEKLGWGEDDGDGNEDEDDEDPWYAEVGTGTR
ncbi:hypothetical protein F53441_8002 [Fusarium austroafricanum]|uniref:Protein kinase domain-containing protein n=1 Tax=Fusarium austroafricanum TaxID=2364996 RepID=A0A8H4KEH8_9HYPO|nr:hypothetical protein F53441_8002 [Fusarium austroafricanum]